MSRESPEAKLLAQQREEKIGASLRTVPATGGNEGGGGGDEKYGKTGQQKNQRDRDEAVCERSKHDSYELLHGKLAALSCYER